MQHKYKKLEKRVKELKRTVLDLSEDLEKQRNETDQIKRMMACFVASINMKGSNIGGANIVELENSF